jgi:hypothetical protein
MAFARFFGENPPNNGAVSGISLVSGWKCVAEGQITVHFDGENFGVSVAYGTSRGDALSVCSDSNNGFGSLSTGTCSGMAGAQLQTKIEQLNTVLEEYADELGRGEFLVVTPAQIGVAGRPRGED